MTDEPSAAVIDVAHQRKRLIWMVAFDAVCFVIALAALVGNVGFHIRWMLWVFLVAMLAGFAAQGWLVMGLNRKA